jgi:DNA-binding NarL/FixJ family response regulator
MRVVVEADAADSDKATGSIVRTVLGQCPSYEEVPALSNREWDILELTADGLRNRDICRVLGLQTSTITRYFLRLQSKLEADSVVHCIVRAVELGLLTVIDGKLQRNPETI